MVNEYSIWLLPEAPQQAHLSAIVVALAKRFGTQSFIPHVTIQGDLTGPFDALAGAVQDIANEQTAQHWPVARIDSSEHFFRSLYARFDEYPAYLSMQQSMQRLSCTAVGLSLFPHLSLAYGLTDAQKTTALFTELQQAFSGPLHFDRLVIARSSKNVPIADWECLAEFVLAGDKLEKNEIRIHFSPQTPHTDEPR